MPRSGEPRLSYQTLQVLQAFLERPADQLAGTDLQRRTGLASGTLYPILARLEDAGWLSSAWEDLDPHKAGRPRRRYYRITASGVSLAQNAFRQIRISAESPASVLGSPA
jgi:PadR family transcriptional regulator, regulatory protein PadR